MTIRAGCSHCLPGHPASLMHVSGATKYRVPDARYRSGYRLTPAGRRARRKWKLLAAAWVLLLLLSAAAHDMLLPLLATIGLAVYAAHRSRVNHRELAPAPPAPPLCRPPDAPAGERRTRHIPQAVKVAVAVRDGGRCQCRAGAACHGYPQVCGSVLEPHFDHIIAWSKGGADTVANLQILCGPCNRRKGADDIT
jgi:HNH endonuclease